MNIKKYIRKNYINAKGWRTNRKLLVIESDDWGATTIPSLSCSQKLKNMGLNINSSYFSIYDHIESTNDFDALFNTLSSVKDKNGRSAIISTESVVCNPNFEAITSNGKNEYIPESIIDTYKRFNYCERSYELFIQGIKERLIYPQFHGREHIHVKRWMEAINMNPKLKFAFEQRAVVSTMEEKDYGFFCAMDYSNPAEETQMKEIIKDGLERFRKIFGFNSKSYVCPSNILGLGINKIFANNGVFFCQTGQHYLRLANRRIKLKNYYWGEKDSNGILFWRRNCTFEPAKNQNYDWVGNCLKEISIAFFWGKPAVINSHRVNYVGSLYETNRSNSLKKLKKLLIEIKKRWPEVEFINSEDLATIIEDKQFYIDKNFLELE